MHFGNVRGRFLRAETGSGHVQWRLALAALHFDDIGGADKLCLRDTDHGDAQGGMQMSTQAWLAILQPDVSIDDDNIRAWTTGQYIHQARQLAPVEFTGLIVSHI